MPALGDVPFTVGISPPNRDLLNVFVCGPGQGEGIAVALPGSGWLLIDGCRQRGTKVGLLQELWETHSTGPDDDVRAILLTHGHDDHYHGVAELIDEHRDALVGCVVGGASPEAGIRTVAEALAARDEATKSTRDPAEKHIVKQATRVMRAVEASWETAGRRLPLRDGQPVPLGSTQVVATVVAPSVAGIVAFMQGAPTALGERLKNRANDLSAVVELQWGTTRFVLGADLPRYRTTTTTAIPTGWDSVMVAHPDLGSHTALKLPHHGSHEAFHPDLHTPASEEARWWVVAPFNSSGLPRAADGQALDDLLQQQPEIHLTALPVGQTYQGQLQPAAQPVRRETLAAAVRSMCTKPPEGADSWEIIDLDAAESTDPFATTCHAAFDDQGHLVARSGGACTLRVVP